MYIRTPKPVWQSLLFATFFQLIHSFIEENCTDMYDRYCKLLTPDKCYADFNRELCCATCAAFGELYGAVTYDERSCDFGDRKAGCEKASTQLCYDRQHREVCCGTCAKIRTTMPHCLYGDKNVAECRNVTPFMCYKKSIRKNCCGTCAQYYTGRQGCEYGDRKDWFPKYNKIYNCVAYVGHFGTSRCYWDNSFNNICCGSCHKSNHKSNYIYG